MSIQFLFLFSKYNLNGNNMYFKIGYFSKQIIERGEKHDLPCHNNHYYCYICSY